MFELPQGVDLQRTARESDTASAETLVFIHAQHTTGLVGRGKVAGQRRLDAKNRAADDGARIDRRATGIGAVAGELHVAGAALGEGGEGRRTAVVDCALERGVLVVTGDGECAGACDAVGDGAGVGVARHRRLEASECEALACEIKRAGIIDGKVHTGNTGREARDAACGIRLAGQGTSGGGRRQHESGAVRD